MKRALLFLLAAVGFSPPVVAFEIGDFFRPAQAIVATMSPDGRLVGTAEHVDGQLLIAIHDLESGQRYPVFDTRERLAVEESSILRLVWLDSEYIAIVTTEDRDGVAELLNTRTRTSTYIAQATRDDNEIAASVYEVKTGGNIVNALPGVDGEFLFGRSGIRSSVYRIAIEKLNRLDEVLTRRTRVDGGQFSPTNEVASFSGYVFEWFFDDSDTVKSVFAMNMAGKIQIASIDDADTWSAHREWGDLEEYVDSDDQIYPLAMGADTDEYYAVVKNEGQTDGLYLERLSSGQRTLIYRHPTADIFQIVEGADNDAIRAIGILDRGDIRFVYLQKDLELAATELTRQVPDANIRLIDRSPDSEQFLVSVFAFDRPESFYIWHPNDGALRSLADSMPWLNDMTLANPISSTVNSHGLEIPYLLTLPAGRDSPFPLVLLPHGGPIGVADRNSFDPVAQLLAFEGYAVLQVNYRGSSGYGDDFLNAGKKEWGAKILDDILAAFAEVTKRTDIDSARACAVGSSYGGYAALRVGLENPQLFRCAVSVSGVTDVALLAASPNLSAGTRDWVAEFIGDPLADFDNLAKISPLQMAGDSEIPVLLLHGLQDSVVDVEHAYRMAYVLELYGKPHELKVFPEMRHGLSGPEEAQALFGDVLEFLQSSLRQSGKE